MVQNEQVHDEPVAGDAGGPNKEATQEDVNSDSVSSDNREGSTGRTETPEAAVPDAGDQEQERYPAGVPQRVQLVAGDQHHGAQRRLVHGRQQHAEGDDPDQRLVVELEARPGKLDQRRVL